MADKEVKIDFVTKSKGDGAQKAKRELDKLEQSIKKAARTTDKKTLADQRADKKVEDLTISAADLRRELAKATGLDPRAKKTIDDFANSIERAEKQGNKFTVSQKNQRKATGNSGLAILELSRGLEDLQYGVRGVLNNIPQLVLQLGGTAGLAGVISLAAVGLSQLVERLSETEEKVEEVNEIVEELEGNLKDLHKELADADFATYANKLDLIDEKIERENRSLKNNISLLDLKRKSELKLAAAQDDLELAEIAASEARGEISAGQAAEGRANIQRRRLSRDASSVEAEVRSQIDKLTQERLISVQELADREEQLVKLAEDRAKAEVELSELYSKRAQAETLLKQAEEKDEEGFPQAAQTLRGTAQDVFGASASQQFDALSKTIIPGIISAQGKIADQMIELRGSIQEQGENLDAVEKAGQITIETAKDLASIKTKTIDVKEEVRKQAALAKDVEETTNDILESVNQAEISGAARQNIAKLEGIMTDKVKNEHQLGEAVQRLTNLNIAGAIPIPEIQADIRLLARKYDEIQREQARNREALQRISTQRP